MAFFSLKSRFFVKKNNSDSSVRLITKRKSFTEKIAQVPHDEPWKVTIIHYAWITGPVSIIAAAGGWYMGYGQQLPHDRALYFITYSTIVIVLGLFTKFVYNMTHLKQKKKNETRLLTAINYLSEGVVMVRELIASRLNAEVRKIHCSGMLLNQINSSAETIALAINDLTNDDQLMKLALRIETYRKAGLYQRMRDLVQEGTHLVNEQFNKLIDTYPKTAKLFKERMSGIVPLASEGIPREKLFLERILKAIEENNMDLMTLIDVENLLVLALELLAGRRITYLKLEYVGDWSLAKALDKLEEERNTFRINQATILSRSKALNNYLNTINMDTTLIVGQGNRSSQLLKAVTSTIDQLVSQVYEARTKVVATDGKSLMTLYLKHKHLEKCLTLYKSVYQAYSLQNKYTQSMSRALNFWQQKANELQLKKTESIRHNFKISEQSIDLSYQNKILLSKKLINYYQESRLRTTALKSATDDEKNNKDFTITRAKELALEIAMVLMELINLNKPQIQRAIEGSPAMNPTIIESGVSAQSRYHSICFMAEEVKVNKAILAERIAQNLIRYYQVPLSKATINFLVETYQANREKINFIANYETPINFRIAFDRFDSIDVPKPKTTWEEEFYYSRRVLNKFAHA